MKKKEKVLIEANKSSSTMNKHDNDFNYAVQVTRIILRSIGASPNPNYVSNMERIDTRFQNVICHFLFGFIIVPSFL